MGNPAFCANLCWKLLRNLKSRFSFRFCLDLSFWRKKYPRWAPAWRDKFVLAKKWKNLNFGRSSRRKTKSSRQSRHQLRPWNLFLLFKSALLIAKTVALFCLFSKCRLSLSVVCDSLLHFDQLDETLPIFRYVPTFLKFQEIRRLFASLDCL